MENDPFYLSLLGVGPDKIDEHDGDVNAACRVYRSKVFFQRCPGCFRLLQVSIVYTLEAKWATQEQSSKAISKENQGRFVVKSAVTSRSISA